MALLTNTANNRRSRKLLASLRYPIITNIALTHPNNETAPNTICKPPTTFVINNARWNESHCSTVAGIFGQFSEIAKSTEFADLSGAKNRKSKRKKSQAKLPTRSRP